MLTSSPTDQTPGLPSERGAPRPVLLVLALAGVGLHVWLLFAPVGAIDSDTAAMGLMARHVPDEVSALFWSQNYGGTIEAYLAAPVFTVVGTTSYALKAIPMVLAALVAVLTWRVGRRLVGESAGRVAGVMMWIAPAAFVWWSTKLSIYWAALGAALLAVLLTLRLAERATVSIGEPAGLGLAAGVAWWTNPQTAYLMGPALLLLSPRLLPHWRRLPLVVLGTVVGALPWILFNLRNDWSALDVPPQPDVPNSYGDHLSLFFRRLLPMALGLRIPFSKEWVLGPVGQAVYVAALAAFVVALIRSRSIRSIRVPVLLAAVYPFLYALPPTSWYADQPRYLLFLAPTLAILLGRLVATHRLLATAALAAMLVLAVGGLLVLNEDGGSRVHPYAPDRTVPWNLSDLHDLLEEHDVGFAYAHYWLAYRATFEGDEDIIITPALTSRYAPYVDQVRRSGQHWFAFLAESRSVELFLEAAADRGAATEVYERGDFVLIRPDREILPEHIPHVWAD